MKMTTEQLALELAVKFTEALQLVSDYTDQVLERAKETERKLEELKNG